MYLKETIIDKLQKKYLNMPEYLECHLWREWHENTKKDKPKLYFLLYTIPDNIDTVWFKLTNPIATIYYKVKHVVKPSYWHRWIIKPDLNIGYNDGRELLLYSSMRILKDFYEFQISDDCFVDWAVSEQHVQAFSEMKVIYDWWEKYEETSNNIWIIPEHILEPEHVFSKNVEKEHPEYMTYIRNAGKKEQELDDEADEMLCRLAKIRQSLWD